MNPYAVLGVSPSASKDEAKAAFRRLAQDECKMLNRVNELAK